MTIKVAYKDVVAFLEANKTKKVSTILDEVKAMCGAKNSSNVEGKTFHKNDEGVVVAIHCYYFKKWFLLDEVEFGKKANTASGYNTMCKKGVSLWTKQQRVAKQAKELLLTSLTNGELEVSELPNKQADIEEARKAIAVEESLLSFQHDSLAEALASVETK